MKRLLIFGAILLFALTASAGPDHVEVGSFKAHNGDRVIAIYEVNGGQYTEVNLIFPDGRRVGIAVEKGTKPATIDRALQHFVDDNWNNVCTP